MICFSFLFLILLVAQYGSTWHTASTSVISTYSAFSKDKMTAEIGGYIGLMHINITYIGMYVYFDIISLHQFEKRTHFHQPWISFAT